ncbi:hypothetical protein BH20ACI1_BH20ACI1_20000 [soil metagenome]
MFNVSSYNFYCSYFYLVFAKKLSDCDFMYFIGDSIRPRNYCLMNPFRDKNPEIFAENILQELKNGNINVLVPYLIDSTYDQRNQVLENEAKYQVIDWRIGYREDSENKITLTYWVSRKNYFDGQLENVSFFFERENEELKLKHFGAIY